MGVNLSCSGCKRVPIWVHFYSVPVEYWMEEGLSYIASVVGQPLHADQMTEAVKRINFTRVCVEIGVDDELPECFDIELLDGSCVEIRVEYNWVPKRCMVCKEFGHMTKKCKKVKVSEWRPKEPPSRVPSRPSSPGINVDDNVHNSPVVAGTSNEARKEVKRNGKAVVVAVSPPTVPKAQVSCSLSNVFDVLQDGLEVEDARNSKAIVLASQMDPLDFSKPSDDGVSSFIISKGDNHWVSPLPRNDGVGQGGSPSSECHSVPISNPLLEKIHMVDELE